MLKKSTALRHSRIKADCAVFIGISNNHRLAVVVAFYCIYIVQYNYTIFAKK